MYKILIDESTSENLERWHYEGDYFEIIQDIKETWLDKGITVTIHQRKINNGNGELYMIWIEEE